MGKEYFVLLLAFVVAAPHFPKAVGLCIALGFFGVALLGMAI